MWASKVVLLVKQSQSFFVRDSRMNLKACCGLLTNKEDEDYDYDDVEQEPLPKPQMALETRKKVRESKQHSEYTYAFYSRIRNLKFALLLL